MGGGEHGVGGQRLEGARYLYVAGAEADASTRRGHGTGLLNTIASGNRCSDVMQGDASSVGGLVAAFGDVPPPPAVARLALASVKEPSRIPLLLHGGVQIATELCRTVSNPRFFAPVP